MALGVNGLNQNIFVTKSSGTVSGSELSKVTQEILSSRNTSSSQATSFTGFNTGRTLDVSLYGFNASNDTNAIKLAATNTSGYDLQMSDKTLSALNSLNSKAAADMLNNVAQLRNGLIHVNNEKPDVAALKTAAPLSNQTQVFESADLSKDRKGSSPFYVPRNTKSEAKKEEGLNLVA